MGRHSASAKERIIDAAEQVVIDRGAGHLTFDAVAARSGVSRGGLLYHFPDKEALLKAMLDRFSERSVESRIRKRSELPEGAEREIAAHVLSSLEIDVRAQKVAMAAVFALAAHDPALLAPIRQQYREFMEELAAGGLRFERAAIVMLATDGLRLLELLCMSPFDKERDAIITELITLAKEGKAQASPPVRSRDKSPRDKA